MVFTSYIASIICHCTLVWRGWWKHEGIFVQHNIWSWLSRRAAIIYVMGLVGGWRMLVSKWKRLKRTGLGYWEGAGIKPEVLQAGALSNHAVNEIFLSIYRLQKKMLDSSHQRTPSEYSIASAKTSIGCDTFFLKYKVRKEWSTRKETVPAR